PRGDPGRRTRGPPLRRLALRSSAFSSIPPERQEFTLNGSVSRRKPTAQRLRKSCRSEELQYPQMSMTERLALHFPLLEPDRRLPFPFADLSCIAAHNQSAERG